MNQSPIDEERHWSSIDIDRPVDLHGDPPYDVERVIGRLQAAHRLAPERVLDIGCGVGRLTNAVAKKVGVHGGTVLGFDISSRNVFEAVSGAPANAYYWHSDGRNIPAGITGTFDLVYAITVFQHIPHDAKWNYIRQAADRLRDGGVFVFTLAVGDEPATFLNHQFTHTELEDFAAALTDLFTTVSVDGPDENGWTWVEARK